MTLLSQCIVRYQGGGHRALAVRMRPNTFWGGVDSDRWEWYTFAYYRRYASGRWVRWNRSELWERDLIVTETSWFSGARGYILESINNNTLRLHWVTMREHEAGLEIVRVRQRTVTHEWFATDMYRERRAAGLRLAQNVSVVVVVVCGASLAAGFGPFAGIFGLGASGGTATSVVVGAVSNALATFIHANFGAMRDAVRNDPENGATHFYRSHEADFSEILSDTFVSGAFGGATALIPAPPGVSSLDDLLAVMANRMGNAFAGIVQSIVASMISGSYQTQSVNEIRESLREDFIRNLVIRSFG